MEAARAGPTWLRDPSGKRMIAQNNFHNGEAWSHAVSNAPMRLDYKKQGDPDEDWWLRSNDRSRMRADGAFSYYNSSPLKKHNFGADALQHNHSRRVFSKLAKQGHSFSESNLRALREDPGLRKEMARRYNEVMRTSPAMPSPTAAAASGASASPTGSRRLGSQRSTGSLAEPGAALRALQDTPKKQAPKPPKWGTKDACPKAELQALATGKRVVVLPNPRLSQGQKVQAEIHQPRPPTKSRGNPPVVFDYEGEQMLY